MDSRTGEIVNLNQIEAELAQVEYNAWLAGVTKEKPRYIPIKGDGVPFDKLTAKQRKRLKIKSYKDFCR